MFGFFKRKPAADKNVVVETPNVDQSAPAATSDSVTALNTDVAAPTVKVVASNELTVEAKAPENSGWFARLKSGLSRTSSNISSAFSRVKIDEQLYEELETALLTSDTGVTTTQYVLDQLRERVRRDRLTDSSQVRQALKAILFDIMRPLESSIDIHRVTPLVMMISGVNGAGKTTTIGKITHHLQREGKSVLLAAGDTFRAAAREQLTAWGEKNNVTVISQIGGDPAAVAFDTVNSAKAKNTGVAIIDTAGRLPTQNHLMDELKKIHRVVGKALEGAPHESLLVLDGNTGQNMLQQARAFDAAVALTGLIVTKLDGTAKGGALVALARERSGNPLPIYFIGVGEGIDDLQAFDAQEFVNALVD
jgi:fused signal recognition particle receptor